MSTIERREMSDIPRLALSVRQPWAWAIIHAGAHATAKTARTGSTMRKSTTTASLRKSTTAKWMQRAARKRRRSHDDR